MGRITWVRAGRWLAAALAALCLAAWLFGGWWELRLSAWTRSRTGWISVESGRVELGLLDHTGSSPPWQTHVDITPLAQLRRPVRSWSWSFHRSRWTAGAGFVGSSIQVPLWAPFASFASLAALLRRVERRRPAGRFPACGYDLAGNTTGFCPECGPVMHP